MEKEKTLPNASYTALVSSFIGALIKAPRLVSVMEPILQPREINQDFLVLPFSTVYRIVIKLIEDGINELDEHRVEQTYINSGSHGNEKSFIAAVNACVEAEANGPAPEEAFFKKLWEQMRKFSLLDSLSAKKFYTGDYDYRTCEKFEQTSEKSQKLEDISLEDIISGYEKDITKIRSKYESKSRTAIHADRGLAELVESLELHPDVGYPTCGLLLTSIMGGARPGTMFLRSAASNAGKAIPNYIKIPMYDGTWKKVGDVRPGDILIGSDGGPTEVLKIYPQIGTKETYEIKFRDGRVAQCCGEHLWQVEIGGKKLTMETRELFYYVQDSISKAGPPCFIPAVQPVQYSEQKDLPFSVDELAMKILNGGWKLGIPKKYLHDSLERRQRLYDRLTTVSIAGQHYQIFDSIRNAEDYRQLCFSLGLTARMIEARDYYRVESWKAEKLQIVSIENTGIVCHMTCFTVDAVDALFCINDYIVTHNTRLSVFDACKLAYPLHYDQKLQSFIIEKKPPIKVLYITTEMTTQEIQTICLAYVSGVEEQHIKRGTCTPQEKIRIRSGIKIMEKYHDYLILDSIPNPDLNNVRSVIKRHLIMEGISAVYFDYIFTSPALLAQFSSNNIREDVALAMLSNQLKEIAAEFNVFIATSTQLNGDGLKLGEKRDQRVLRSSKAIADKPDTACILAKVSPEELEMVRPYISELGAPTHVFDIYKLRSGTYKNHRVWSQIDLGTGRWKDLFVTTETNQLVHLDEFTLIQRIDEEIVTSGQFEIVLDDFDIETGAYKKG